MRFDDFLEEQLKDEELKREYDALQFERDFVTAMVKARNEKGMTQKELAEITGINQKNISMIENGNGNPSIKTLMKLAWGLDKHLEIRFV